MKTVLVPVDFSDATGRVVFEASRLAHALGARIVLMHSVPPPTIGDDSAAGATSLMASIKEDSLAQLAKWQQALKDLELKADIMTLYGPPVQMILAEMERLHPDYIVMGSHGHSAFYELLAGSTTSGVLRKAPCPVVIVAADKSHHPDAELWASRFSESRTAPCAATPTS